MTVHGWHTPTRYDVRERIGFGSYGSVREAYDRDEERIVAIKRQRHVFRDPVDSKRILREVAILTRLNHGNIVQLYDIYVDWDPADFDELYFAMEACDTDLKEFLRRDIRVEPNTINSMMYDLFVGLKYLHSAGIYHRDLKPANCLLNKDLCLKICDFGLARSVVTEKSKRRRSFTKEPTNRAATLDSFPAENEDSDLLTLPLFKRNLTGHIGTRWYRAPELILLQQNYNEKVDVWSAGCIYAELLELLPEGPPPESRQPLFPGQSCEPVSPCRSPSKPKAADEQFGQLNQIFRVIGTPSDEDIDALEGESSRNYAKRSDWCEGLGLENMFDYAPADAQQFLEKMLVFNPTYRISVALAIEDVVFTGIRNPNNERLAPGRIAFDFEEEDDPDEEYLQDAFAREISRFHDAKGTPTSVGGFSPRRIGSCRFGSESSLNTESESTPRTVHGGRSGYISGIGFHTTAAVVQEGCFASFRRSPLQQRISSERKHKTLFPALLSRTLGCFA